MDVQTKKFFRAFKKEGGRTNKVDNDIIKNTFKRIGADIMSKRMFIVGEAN